MLFQSQGQTLDEVLLDFGEKPMIQYGLFYTAMSRVKTGESLYIKNFNEKYVKANPLVEPKKAAMELCSRYQFKKVYLDEEIFDKNEEIKIGYINIRGLLKGKSLEFINNDRNLQQLSYLVVAETWLDDSTTPGYLTEHLSNWKVAYRSDAKDGRQHMGLLLLKGQSASGQINMRILNEHRWRKRNSVMAQILVVIFEEYLLQTSFVYINKTPTDAEMTRLCDVCKYSHLVIGDLNLDISRDGDQGKLSALCGQTRSRILKEITTDQFSQLDHILLNENVWPDSFSTSFSQFTSDHKTVTVRLPNLITRNKFSNKFKQRLHFDQSKETIIGQKRKAEPCSQSPKKPRPSEKSRKRRSGEIDADNTPAKTSRRVPVHETVPTLSQEMLTVINNVYRLPDDSIVSEYGTWFITKREIASLKGLTWLTSDVIDFMFNLISQNSESTHAFTLNFSLMLARNDHETMGHFTDGFDIFTKMKILLPVHTGDHWSCVGVDMQQKKIIYYDSLGRENNVRQLIFHLINN